jgi:hypothetical protein
MALKFRRGTTAQKSGSLAFGEPFVNTDLQTLQIGLDAGDIELVSKDDFNTFTSSIDSTLQTTRINQLAAATASINEYTASNNSKWSTLDSLSSSFARTNSTNIFSGNQTITGSLFISQDLIVQGSSSIQTISSSRLDIGDNIIQLNVNNPSLRFGGLAIVDSGSAGSSGSFLYDSLHDEFIFVHKGNGINVTSSHFVLGPETYDNLGTETYLTNNKIPKGTGKEHLNDSNITDDGTLITLGSNTTITGTLVASGTSLVSSSAQVVGILSSLNTYTGSNDTTNTAQTARLTTIESATGSYETKGRGIVSGSSQITFSGISSLPTLVSGSSQITLSSTTGGGTASSVQFGSLGIGTAASGVTGEIRATADITAYYSSDIRLKENIQPIENALDKIRRISGNTYDWKEGFETIHSHKGNDIGVIAQEVEEVLPILVTTREHGYKAVQYEKIVALLIEGMKEQQLQIEQLRIDLDNCRNNKGL